nr:protein TOC75-3, chloroplastic [Tanacetum cinerariifolium]
MTRDNTKSVNGETVGDRNVIQIEQGVGIGSSFSIFNRHQLTMTKFIQLKNVEEGVGKRPPPMLGYNSGEIGDGRKKLELAAELRLPVVNTPVGNTVVYVFAEHGNDLGSSEDVNANQRKGHGSSYGAGLKLGQLRAEYVVNHNSGTGGLMFGFGDRF